MPPVTAPPTPTPAPAAAPSPTPPPSPPVNSITGKPISEAAHKLFQMIEEHGNPERDDPPKKADDAPAPTPDPAPPAPAPTADKPIKVSAKKVPKRPELPIEKPAEAPAPAPTPAPAAADDGWENELIDEEKLALDEARTAEAANPKFKGLADRMGKFFRDQKKYLDAHPDADDQDPEYKRILAQKPIISAADKREIADSRIEGRVAKRYDSKITDLQHELFIRDEEPKVEQEAVQIRRHLAFNALPADMLTTLREKGLPVLQKEFADELEVAGSLINTLVEDAKELLRITRINPKSQKSIGQVATDESHPKFTQHNRIASMVAAACDDFHKTAPQSEQLRDGKWFVTRDEWAKLAPVARSQFWTFTNSDAHVREMINRAMGWMPHAISHSIKARQDALQKRGYVRQRSEAPPPAAPPAPSPGAPTPRPSPSPSPSTTPGSPLSPGAILARRLAGV